MLSLFDNTKIATKSIIPVMGMAVLFASIVALAGFELKTATSQYAEMTDRADPAVVAMLRVSKDMAQLGYNLYKSSTLTCLGADGATCRELDASLASSLDDGLKNLDRTSTLDPAHLADVESFKGRFKTVAAAVRNALALSDQDKNAEAAKAMATADPEIRALMEDIRTFDDQRLADTAARSATLDTSANHALTIMIMSGVAAALGGLAAAIWMSRITVANPLVRLSERMRALATGDLTVNVEGAQRRDEIGTMAKAVQTFKDNALKLEAAEAEASRRHKEAEAERRSAEAARERAARELEEVVDNLAAGLASLSSGDLTHRVAQPFAPQYEKLRTDFNKAMDSLHEA
ncbi:MAG: methyl-accepting chemotaxis protein, partial [Caulobacteraceae bacterium]|nr:methyl-accepting chemotaxis protein [Caulobacteraceae bacterium]